MKAKKKKVRLLIAPKKKEILLRYSDIKLYSKFKATAAMYGIVGYRALEEAMQLWIASKKSDNHSTIGGGNYGTEI